jgi:NACHT domain/Effector-associated domain 10
MSENFQKIIDRVKAGNHTQEDVLAIVSEFSAGKLVLASGSGAVAIGGDAANALIVTGNQNVIGDHNNIFYIYGAESAIVQSVIDRYSAIDNTFQRRFPPSASSEVDWDWGMKLLKQKQLPDIRKRLTDTLGRDRVLMDVSIEERQNWVNRFPLAADRTLQIDGRDCGTLDANKMLIETFGRDDIEGKLLILGAPGAGKTTTLLSLAEQLVEGAISQRGTVIPVIFELSTWRNDNQSIQSWLIEQLYDLHGGNRKSKLYEKWLERQVLLPLMDGLDELGLERQKKCTEKLNEFAEHYPQLVVCCRVKEFEAVDIKLRNLRGAVCLQSLSDSQIQDYLDTLKRSELWEAIQTTPSLQSMLEPTTEGDPGLLRVPLFVKLVADVYDPQQPISSKADLLDKYIDRQLSFDKREIDRGNKQKDERWAYKTVKLEPDWKKTRKNLNWLARDLQVNNKVEFLIEHLQPSSIDPIWMEPLRLQQRYHLIFGIIFLLITGLISGLISGLNIGLITVLMIGLMIGLIIGLIFKPMMIGQMMIVLISILKIGQMIGMNIELMNIRLISDPMISTIMMIGLMIGLIIGSIFGWIDILSKIEPVEAFKISISSSARQELLVSLRSGLISRPISMLIRCSIMGLIMGLIIGLISAVISREIIGLMFGLISGLMFGLLMFCLIISLYIGLNIVPQIFRLINGLRQELKLRSCPNQGIWKSLHNQFLITTIFFIPIILLFIPFFWLQYWQIGLFIALFFGFAVGGGKACLQHLSLRIVLWQSGLPWNFACFLNYCVERRLLLRVGGSYRFLHRELLDHFAQSSR